MPRAQRPSHPGHCVTDRTSKGRRENSSPRLKSCRAQRNQRRQVRDGKPRGGVTNVLGNQTEMLLLHRDPFTERSVFKDAVWAREPHSGTLRKLVVSAPLDNAGPFVAQHERRFCLWIAPR